MCARRSVSYHLGWIACRIWVCHELGSEPPLPLRLSPHSPKPGIHTHTQRNSKSFSNNENIEPRTGLSPAQGFLFTFWFGLISSPHSAVFFDITHSEIAGHLTPFWMCHCPLVDGKWLENPYYPIAKKKKQTNNLSVQRFFSASKKLNYIILVLVLQLKAVLGPVWTEYGPTTETRIWTNLLWQ